MPQASETSIMLLPLAGYGQGTFAPRSLWTNDAIQYGKSVTIGPVPFGVCCIASVFSLEKAVPGFRTSRSDSFCDARLAGRAASVSIGWLFLYRTFGVMKRLMDNPRALSYRQHIAVMLLPRN
ncbi:hypothetical protein BDW75DRAFT_149568 [Aspergillus navahoensis]